MSTARRGQNSTKSSSKRFKRVFDNVPGYVRRRIIEQALIPLLDSATPKDAKRAILSARKIARGAEKLPKVDLTGKKTELNGLLDKLEKEARRRTSDTFDALLSEIADSVVEWLNDLWTFAVEHGFDFLGMHSCLLYSIGVLDHMQTLKSSGCRCTFQSICAPIQIRNIKGEVLKEFNEVGLSNVETAIFWVWREVFVALFASNDPTYIREVPESLKEIDDIFGWTGLERLILGGATYEEYIENWRGHIENPGDQKSQCDPSECVDGGDSGSSWSLSEEHQDDTDEMLYEEHWTSRFVKQVPRFHRFVLKRMLEIFSASPSVPLYEFLRLISLANRECRWVLFDMLNVTFELAPTSAVTLSTALEIFSAQEHHDVIEHLLRLYSHLLRPRDSEAYQKAVKTLATSNGTDKLDLAFCLAKQELLDTTDCIFHALKGPFASIDTPTQRAELAGILRLPRASEERRQRVKTWVNAAQTNTSENPMTIAAMMIGGIGFGMGVPMAIPVPIPENPPGAAFGGANAAPGAGDGGGDGDGDAGGVADGDGEGEGEGEEGGGAGTGGFFAAALNAALEDPVDQSSTFMNFDPNDPEYAAEYADLREEYMPDLKGRFNGWLETTGSVALEGELAIARALKEHWNQESVNANGNGKGKSMDGKDIDEDGGDNEERRRGIDELGDSSKKMEEAFDEVISRMLVLMPWLQARDIIEQLLRSMANKPRKRHVVEALEVMHDFVKQCISKQHDVKQRAAELVTKVMGLNGIVGETSRAVAGNGFSRELGDAASTEDVKPALSTSDADGEVHPIMDGVNGTEDVFSLPAHNSSSGRSQHPGGLILEHETNHEHVSVNDSAAVEYEFAGLSDFRPGNGHELDQGQSIFFGNVELDEEPPPLEPVSGASGAHPQFHPSREQRQDAEESGSVTTDGPQPFSSVAMENIEDID